MENRLEQINDIVFALEKSLNVCNALIEDQDDSRRKFYSIDNVLSVVKESLIMNDISYFKFIELLDAKLKRSEPSVKKDIDRTNTINKHQYDELIRDLDGMSSLAKEIMKAYDINTLADLPASEYHKARDKITHIKNTEKEHSRKR